MDVNTASTKSCRDRGAKLQDYSNRINRLCVGESSPEKAGVGGSIPSLATIFSITYRPTFCRSVSNCQQKSFGARGCAVTLDPSHQLRDRHPEAPSQSFDRPQAGLAPAVLQSGDVFAAESALSCKIRLAPASAFAQPAYPLAEPDSDIPIWHAPRMRAAGPRCVTYRSQSRFRKDEAMRTLEIDSSHSRYRGMEYWNEVGSTRNSHPRAGCIRRQHRAGTNNRRGNYLGAVPMLRLAGLPAALSAKIDITATARRDRIPGLISFQGGGAR
jgi:hypothetical protein